MFYFLGGAGLCVVALDMFWAQGIYLLWIRNAFSIAHKKATNKQAERGRSQQPTDSMGLCEDHTEPKQRI